VLLGQLVNLLMQQPVLPCQHHHLFAENRILEAARLIPDR
jgi:hypothetical protein